MAKKRKPDPEMIQRLRDQGIIVDRVRPGLQSRADPAIGRRIVTIRKMTRVEMDAEGWDEPATVLVLDDGTRLYASRDSEGNAPGVMFGVTKAGESFGFPSYY